MTSSVLLANVTLIPSMIFSTSPAIFDSSRILIVVLNWVDPWRHDADLKQPEQLIWSVPSSMQVPSTPTRPTGRWWPESTRGSNCFFCCSPCVLLPCLYIPCTFFFHIQAPTTAFSPSGAGYGSKSAASGAGRWKSGGRCVRTR